MPMQQPPISWKLSELKKPDSGAPTVFSCFHCGGGSTMGYKLAGYNVLGGVEIDPEMMAVYKANHNPKHSYLMGVQEFNKISNEELPKELFELDILDGSPPCSSFSMAGAREKKWGKNTHFREGQAVQVLDDLFFQFIETANKLKPKIVVAENVKGLIQGNAKYYVKQIFKAFENAGYETQLFLLNAAFMGVPQRRERTFFIAQKKESFKKLEVKPNLSPINFKEIESKNKFGAKYLKGQSLDNWKKTQAGNGLGKIGKFNSQKKISKIGPIFTNTATIRHWHYEEPRSLSDIEVIRTQTFPEDFNFLNEDPCYVCGMSVPPRMMQYLATDIKEQLLD